jgi:septal ring factor EnvC (AmiA/AmiB activator)
MKKLLVLLMALGLFAAMPVLAAEHDGMKMDSHAGMKMDTPDGMRECALQAESIQQKIKRLNTEIAKGTKKHSAEDLKKLENQLKETNKLLDQMNNR